MDNTEPTILISERDKLVLEWELHSIRYFLQNVRMTVGGAAKAYRMPDLQDGRKIHHWETSPEEYNSHMDKRWRGLLPELDSLQKDYQEEVIWWQENKDKVSLDLLRQAVRRLIAKTGGAQADEPEIEDVRRHPDPPKEIRSLRWLLNIRAEIARRRMFIGELYVLSQEGQLHGLDWTEIRFEALSRRITDAAYDTDTSDKTIMELEALVTRREAAAAAFKVTGEHTAPLLLEAGLV